MTFWVIGDRNDGAVLDAYPQKGPEGWRYLRSHRLAPEFHNGVEMKFSPRLPDRHVIYDFVTTILDIRVVSERVRKVVEPLAREHVEFLPVTLIDHKGRVASREHYIMNLLTWRDVIDLERSDVRMGAILKDEIGRINTLVLKEKIEPSDAKVFRPEHLYMHTMVDADVHEAFKAAGFTGCTLFPANGWNGKVW